MYIENTDIKSITTKDKNDNSGMFRIGFEDDNNDEVYFYNIVEKDNNIDKTRPIFDELFKTEIGDKNAKFNFVMLDKAQYISKTKELDNDVINSLNLYTLKINSLTMYIQKWCKRNDLNSARILDLKNRNQDAVLHYSRLVYRWLEEKNILIAIR